MTGKGQNYLMQRSDRCSGTRIWVDLGRYAL